MFAFEPTKAWTGCRLNRRIYPTATDGPCVVERLRFKLPSTFLPFTAVNSRSRTSCKHSDSRSLYLLPRTWTQSKTATRSRSESCSPSSGRLQQHLRRLYRRILGAMSLLHRSIDECMLVTFTRMWDAAWPSLAGATKARRAITRNMAQLNRSMRHVRFILCTMQGEHFEWAHANDAGCGRRSCKRDSKRIPADRIPFNDAEQERSCRHSEGRQPGAPEHP